VPLWLFSALALGYFLGRHHADPLIYSRQFEDRSQKSAGRIEELISYINREYVDSVDTDSLTTIALEAILAALDPHSQYLPASDFDFSEESIEGNFDGIGVEFQIFRDTIFVTSVVPGGPSEKAGLEQGDRIIAMDGKSLIRKELNNEFVLKTLRGKSGSSVKLELINPYHQNLRRSVMVIRGKIPYHSVSHAMLPEHTGYLSIHHFSLETAREVRAALSDLKQQRMRALIIDLRGNPGGVLQAAVEVCDELLGGNKLITYTQGKAKEKEEFHAGKPGLYESGPLALLMDEYSASASEILAGAIQDHDRGQIVGRRSFGKGFVQEQSRFSDGSGMRLTIARYYTPSGRCIQKPYRREDHYAYYEEAFERMSSGELFSADSIPTAGLPVFRTSAGKKVFGGGGIIPDLFVPLDTSGNSVLLAALETDGILNEMAFDKACTMKANLRLKRTTLSDLLLEVKQASQEELWNELSVSKKYRHFLQKYGMAKKDKTAIIQQFRTLTARFVAKQNMYYEIALLNDEFIKKSVKFFSGASN